MREKIINSYSYFFIILFFPSFVTGIFLPNLVCGIFACMSLIFNFQNLKELFFKYLLPSLCFIFFLYFNFNKFNTFKSFYSLT